MSSDLGPCECEVPLWAIFWPCDCYFCRAAVAPPTAEGGGFALHGYLAVL